MTTAIVHHRRPWLPALNLLLAGGAAVLGVIAITSDDVGSVTPASAAGRRRSVGGPSSTRSPLSDACMQARANEPC